MSAFLIALLAFTGQGMAMARGMPMSVGTMELCSGQHTVIIAVDADGEPTVAQHYCLDCTLLALDLFASDGGAVIPRAASFYAPPLSSVGEVQAQRILSLNARAPPFSV